MSTSKQPGGFGVVIASLMKNLLGRQAAFERVTLEVVAKSEDGARVIESNPSLKQALSNFNPEDLEMVATEFEKALGSFLENGSDNVVKLPMPTNFFGAASGSLNMSAVMSGSNNLGFLGTGSPTVGRSDAGAMRKEIDEIRTTMEKINEKLSGGASGKAVNEGIEAVFAPLRKELEGLAAKVDTHIESQNKDADGAETPPTPVAKESGKTDAEETGPKDAKIEKTEVFTTDDLFGVSGGFGQSASKKN